MNATFDFDRLLASVLDGEGPRTVPASVVETALDTSRGLDQHRPFVRALDRRAWPASRRSLAPRTSQIRSPLVPALILVIIAAAAVALAVVGSTLLREDRTPKVLESTFFRHFEYQIPADGDVRVSGYRNPEMVAWVEGTDDWPIPSGEEVAFDGGPPHPGEMGGLVIGAGGEAWSHGDAGRFMLRTAPAEFLADLRDISGVQMTAIHETTLDGRPAMTATLPGFSGSDIHVTGRMKGLSGTYVVVQWPARLTVADIDGQTVFILVWARTGAELETWLPTATEFVDSIHFVQE